jgi:hypothetical protein
MLRQLLRRQARAEIGIYGCARTALGIVVKHGPMEFAGQRDGGDVQLPATARKALPRLSVPPRQRLRFLMRSMTRTRNPVGAGGALMPTARPLRIDQWRDRAFTTGSMPRSSHWCASGTRFRRRGRARLTIVHPINLAMTQIQPRTPVDCVVERSVCVVVLQ